MNTKATRATCEAALHATLANMDFVMTEADFNLSVDLACLRKTKAAQIECLVRSIRRYGRPFLWQALYGKAMDYDRHGERGQL